MPDEIDVVVRGRFFDYGCACGEPQDLGMVADGLSEIDTLANDGLVSKRVDYEASTLPSSESCKHV